MKYSIILIIIFSYHLKSVGQNIITNFTTQQFLNRINDRTSLTSDEYANYTYKSWNGEIMVGLLFKNHLISISLGQKYSQGINEIKRLNDNELTTELYNDKRTSKSLKFRIVFEKVYYYKKLTLYTGFTSLLQVKNKDYDTLGSGIYENNQYISGYNIHSESFKTSYLMLDFSTRLYYTLFSDLSIGVNLHNGLYLQFLNSKSSRVTTIYGTDKTIISETVENNSRKGMGFGKGRPVLSIGIQYNFQLKKKSTK